MKLVNYFLLSALAAPALIGCTFHVRESNIVIPRVAPPVDINAFRARAPEYHVDQNWIDTPDGAKLSSVRFLRVDAVATILYFGGNGYTLSRLATQTLTKYVDAPVNVIVVDFRGYGGSSGVPSIDNLMADAIIVYDELANDPDLQALPLVVHGHSLGSFMAGHVAANRELGGVILESTVTTTEDWTVHLRSRQSAWIRLLVRRVVPDDALAGRGNSVVVPRLDEPVLFVVGKSDEVTPSRFSQELFDATPLPVGEKRILIVPGKNHMNASDSPEFRATLSEFIAHVSTSGKNSSRLRMNP